MNTRMIKVLASLQSRRARSQEEGASAVEYILLTVGIAVVLGVAATALGVRMGAKLDAIIP